PNGFPEDNLELEQQIQAYNDALPEVQYEGHSGQIDNVLLAIETGKPVLIDGHSGRATLELIMAIYKSASTGQSVKLPLSSEDSFYTRESTQENAIHFYEKKNSVENFQNIPIQL